MSNTNRAQAELIRISKNTKPDVVSIVKISVDKPLEPDKVREAINLRRLRSITQF